MKKEYLDKPKRTELIIDIHYALQELEETHGWDLSLGESASLIDSLLRSLKPYLKEQKSPTIAQWYSIIDKSYIDTWGKNHECTKTTPEELRVICMGLWFYLPLEKIIKKIDSNKKGNI